MEVMTAVEVRVVMMTVLMLVSRVETVTRVSPEPQCYYQPYYKQLTCSCTSQESNSHSFLGLKMIHYVRTLGQEVRADSH